VGILGRIFARKEPRRVEAFPARVRGGIDAAESVDDARHWAKADWLSVDGALNATKRRTLRNRARYERMNNSYLAGIAETLANELVGTGPRLQLSAVGGEPDRAVETAFADWGVNVRLASKLRTMRMSKLIDGEAFASQITNPLLDGVQLDLRLIEADQIATPMGYYQSQQSPEGSIVDGIEFDAAGNVANYIVLRYHPGSNFRLSDFEFSRIAVAQMHHWFTPIRPAQHRGLSEVAPCLRLFADMRRFTGAVIAAAETAADFAAFLHSNSPAAEVDEIEGGPFQSMEIEKRSMVTLPEGWSVSQLKAEQPTSTYSMFKKEIINEIARCLQLPFNVAALDSSGYNYSSGRMDWQVFAQTIRVQRDELEQTMLDKLFRAWCDEAVLVGGIIPSGMPPISEWKWSWAWDGREHVDPIKEANAAESRLRTHTTTLAAEYSRQGKSWEVELRQRAAELALMRELGLPDQSIPQQSQPQDQNQGAG
jgi:lambda family phage portal protein